jgi:uncharacterized protein
MRRDPGADRPPGRPGPGTLIGLISDTHGLLRPEAIEALGGCSVILHAGDIGDPEVISGLERIAPVIAVRGNVDVAPWAAAIPEQVRVQLGGKLLFMTHDRTQIRGADLSGVDVAVTGHSHQPRIDTRKGVLFMNPGSAGPRRFRLPVTVAHLRIEDGILTPRLINLFPGKTPRAGTAGSGEAGV